MAFTHPEKVELGSFVKARIRIRSQTSGSGFNKKRFGYDRIPPDPDPTEKVWIRSKKSGSASATLLRTYFCKKNLNKKVGQEFIYARIWIRTFLKVGSGSGQKSSRAATMALSDILVS
jgi:hypothetical protein